jgi:myosin I
LQNREYEWPDLAKHQNDISSDLRDLVGSLLVDEDYRPGPDEIVSHPFFKMSFIPDRLDSSCTSVKPTWANVKPPTSDTIRRGYSEGWFKLCKASGVGEYARGRYFSVVGMAGAASVVKDVEREIKANRAPTVPIAAGTVYLPFVSDRKEKGHVVITNLSEIAEERESSKSSQLVEISTNDRSGAAPTTTTKRTQSTRRMKENISPTDNPPEMQQTALKRTRSAKGRIEQAENLDARSRPARAQRLPSDPSKQTAPSIRKRDNETEDQRLQEFNEVRKPRQRVASREKKNSTKQAPQTTTKCGGLIITRCHAAEKTKDPEANDDNAPLEQDKMSPPREKPEAENVSQKRLSDPERRRIVAKTTSDDVLAAHEQPTVLSQVSKTDPQAIWQKARELRNNLAAVLSNRGGLRASKPEAAKQELPFVSKWVDYSKKHGIGYVLTNGTVGCIFNATTTQPVTHVVVRDGYSYLSVSSVPSNLNIPMDQLPVEIYSDGAGAAINQLSVTSERRKTNAILWTKFARYMCQTLSMSGDGREEEGESKSQDSIFVRYYQRLGTVGVWGFSNGCFQVCCHHTGRETRLILIQFNFPDHTKIVLSADATHCSFTCLPVEAMAHIEKYGDLPTKYIKQREVLTASTRSLLYGSAETVEMTRANLLRKKLHFIFSCAESWVRSGGLGSSDQRPQWKGPHLDDAGGKKVDWIAIGGSMLDKETQARILEKERLTGQLLSA